MTSQLIERPIGVFDSGFGGLTVMRSLVEQLPNEDFIYLGDTARAPYGPRSIAEVRAFALEGLDLARRIGKESDDEGQTVYG